MNVENIRLWHRKNLEYLEKMKIVEEITLTDTVSKYTYESDLNANRIGILQKIKDIHEKINPYLFWESIILSVVFIVLSIIRKKKNGEKIILLVGLAGIYLCRIFIISFTYITMYTVAVNVMYLSITYVVQMLFSLLVNIFVIQEIMEIIKNKVLKIQI